MKLCSCVNHYTTVPPPPPNLNEIFASLSLWPFLVLLSTKSNLNNVFQSSLRNSLSATKGLELSGGDGKTIKFPVDDALTLWPYTLSEPH